jgi:hypothetical protein
MILLGGGLVGILLLALWVYCIFDVVSTDESLMRNMPKVLWLVVVILLPTVGAVAWLLLGRPIGAGLRPGDTTPHRPAPRPAQRSLAPDDDPSFLARLDEETRRLRAWEEDLKRREDEFRRRDDEGGPAPEGT